MAVIDMWTTYSVAEENGAALGKQACDMLNDVLNEGYAIKATWVDPANDGLHRRVYFILHKPDDIEEVRARKAKAMGAYAHRVNDDGTVDYLVQQKNVKLSADLKIDVGDPEAFADFLRQNVGIPENNVREIPQGTSFNDWYERS